MPRPDQQAVVKALADFIKLGRDVGLPKAVQPLEKYVAGFQVTQPTLKVLQGPVHSAFSAAFITIRERVYDMRKDRPRPGMKKQDQEFDRCSRAVSDAFFPPEYPETEIVGLAGNKETTTVIGDPTGAKAIAKSSLDAVRQFSKAVFKQDMETAYKLCANELRAAMSVEQFVAGLKRSDSRFGGPAIDMVVERITWIYGDAGSRKKSNASGDWPKDTPKPNKRALVGTFWFVEKSQKRGRWVFFWVTEEAEGYRIAKFMQYLQ
ncbi:MAG: hypothetical protein ACTHLW_19760 [Verrucomicrobiota bacterium]